MAISLGAFNAYFNAIKSVDVTDATEHTPRGALENLLKAVAWEQNPNIRIIHEPKRDKGGLGAPDFKFKLNEAILGYLENKKIGDPLADVLKSAQIAKYKQLSGNIILTNYLEWIWLKDGQLIRRETFCHKRDIGSQRAQLDRDKAEKTGQLLASFLSTPPEKIPKASRLSLALAVRCHELRDFLMVELLRQAKEHQQGRLYGLYFVFKRDVFQELELKEFADAFAQTLGYGLFLAKLNAGEETSVTLQNAKNYIPRNFELIRELVDFLDELERDEYQGIKWLVEEILSIMDTLDLAAIHEDLAFTKRQGQLFKPTEEERLLFAKDPYVYFYEDFLKAYDRETRIRRGVYYTPPPVVNFIIRAVNEILKGTFGISQGLADRRRVTLLDFATGTGTFLIEVLQQIFEEVSESIRDQIIHEHVLKNLYGFEYLIAPYTIAHLKLSQFLQDKGYRMQSGERLQIYLTNTLEPIEPQHNFLLPALSHEVERAQEIKEKPILVITGNPPYAGHSKNPGFRTETVEIISNKKRRMRKVKIMTFIGKLINDYKIVDGKTLGEKNLKWLQDDYVKFIRFAQLKMDQSEEGIVGIITNHRFIDNPTFRGMRQSLMQTFNQIYIFDLYGAPENIFDIKQGVAISLFIKKKGLQRAVFHADLHGTKQAKYRALLEAKKSSLPWRELEPTSPFYLFIPQDVTSRGEYEQGWKVTDIFPVNALGFQTHRDEFAIAFEKTLIERRVRDLLDSEYSDRSLYEKYKIKDNRDWQLIKARMTLRMQQDWQKKVIQCYYRPFDTRWCFFGYQFMDYPRRQLMDHVAWNDNLTLLCSRQIRSERWKHAFISSSPANDCVISDKSKEANYVFPLYLYPLKTELFSEENAITGSNRAENLAPVFRDFLDRKYGHHYSPEEILGYVYAVLHSHTYRSNYLQFLKIDFPRIPFVADHHIFEALSSLGWELVQVHLLRMIPNSSSVDISKGNLTVEKPVFQPQEQRLYINQEKFFAPVPQEAWEFQIGSYQVLDKYLKLRKGRTLSLDEIENVQHVVKALSFTIRQMQKIEEVWRP